MTPAVTVPTPPPARLRAAARPAGPRPVSTAPAGGPDLIRALNSEWARLRQEPDTDHAVRRWARVQPALTSARCLTDLEQLATGPSSDQVLAALLHLSQDGERLATRTVLQLQLGAMVGLALRTRHYAGGDLTEAKARAITGLLEAIAAYPLDRRSGRHASCLALDVLNRLTTHTDSRPGRLVRHTELVEVPHEDLLRTLADQPAPASSEDPARQVLALLQWAVHRRVLSVEDADLLRHQHTSLTGQPDQAELARRLGISHAALRQRSSRATRRLTRAVQQTRTVTPAAAHAAPNWTSDAA